MTGLARFFSSMVSRYMPDSFVIAIILTLITGTLTFLFEHKELGTIVDSWGNGFWNLLTFAMQISIILATGYALAISPLVDRLLNRMVSVVNRPSTAIIVATVAGGVASYLNWGFGLVVGGIVARKLALTVRGVHYPLIVTSAYSAFTLYGLGLSSVIPITISTPGHPLHAQMGLIPLSQTIFSPPMLVASAIVLITLPILNALMHPKNGADVIEFDQSLSKQEFVDEPSSHATGTHHTFASKLNNSRLLAYIIGGLGMVFVVRQIIQGGTININSINLILLFLGIVMVGTPARYVARLSQGVGMISGIILQYPFYAGIMALMASSRLMTLLSDAFAHVATQHTLPLWALLSSYVINIFVPSGGGHWVLQGPFMIAAARELGAPLNQTAMAVQLGNAWNDIVQPLWILPVLALSRLRLADVMGYLVVAMLWIGIVYAGVLLWWGYSA